MTVDSILRALTWRLRFVVFARRLAACWLTALVAAMVLFAADRLFYLGTELLPVILGLGAAATAVSVAWTARAGIGRHLAAVRADAELGLADRLASAEALAGAEQGGWTDAVAKDASERVGDLHPSSVFPLRLGPAGRLLAPAAIALAVLWAVPPLDLAGRMAREAERIAAAAEHAQRQRSAVRSAVERAGAGGASDVDGRLRIQIVRWRKQAGASKLEAERASLRLQRLARALAREPGGAEFAAQLREAAERMARDPAAAARLLERVEQELAEMERALQEAESTTGTLRRRVEEKRAELRTATSPEPDAGSPRPAVEPGDTGDLAELTARTRPPRASTAPGGMVYTEAETGTRGSQAAASHAEAVRTARSEIESGRIPPGRADLIRAYFDAVAPSD
jgi:hypothetical protein